MYVYVSTVCLFVGEYYDFLNSLSLSVVVFRDLENDHKKDWEIN